MLHEAKFRRLAGLMQIGKPDGDEAGAHGEAKRQGEGEAEFYGEHGLSPESSSELRRAGT